ncbi:hypothetical protein, partial [Polaribacter gangjinensis]|uniref:hypothetical protein n=1 Tax=Polaribacter gangjinensis TaxID=574710 RepID=UPI001CFFFA7E
RLLTFFHDLKNTACCCAIVLKSLCFFLSFLHFLCKPNSGQVIQLFRRCEAPQKTMQILPSALAVAKASMWFF